MTEFKVGDLVKAYPRGMSYMTGSIWQILEIDGIYYRLVLKKPAAGMTDQSQIDLWSTTVTERDTIRLLYKPTYHADYSTWYRYVRKAYRYLTTIHINDTPRTKWIITGIFSLHFGGLVFAFSHMLKVVICSSFL